MQSTTLSTTVSTTTQENPDNFWVEGFLPETQANVTSLTEHGITCARMCLSMDSCEMYVIERDLGAMSAPRQINCRLYYESDVTLLPDPHYVTYVV